MRSRRTGTLVHLLLAAVLATPLSPVAASGGAVSDGTAASSVALASPAVPGGAGSVVVGVAPGAESLAESALIEAGAAIQRRSEAGSFVVVRPPAGVAVETFAARAAGLKGVLYAESESVVRASLVPDDPGFGSQWNLERIGMPDAWDVTRGSSDVRIAVVDSGVDLDHPELAGRLDTDADYDFIERDSQADDAYGHGTHVAGIIAAATDNGRGVAGIADGCTILPVRVLDRLGFGWASVMAEGIRYAADQGVDVINISAGDSVDSRVLSDAVDYAVSKGCVIVAAAGNRNSRTLDFPAAYPDVIAVGAVTAGDAKAPYSSYGERLDIVAPGGERAGLQVLSLLPVSATNPAGTGLMHGTSMATPHVAAVAALLRSLNPTWTAGHVTRRILETAEDIGSLGKDDSYGYGLLRADLALGADGDDPQAPSDDTFPGIPLLGESVKGIVDAQTDPVDVHSVGLIAGQELQVWIRGSADATISLTLFDRSGESTADAAPLESVVATGASAVLTYSVPEGGTGRYRLLVRAEEGGGEYALTMRRGRPVFINTTAPRTSAWGGSVSLSGRVVDADGVGMGGLRILLDMRPAGQPGWTVDVAQTLTDDAGRFRLSVRPARPTDYRVRFEGAPGQLAAVSETIRISPRAALGAPEPTGPVRRGVTFTVAGTLKPRYSEDDKVVRVTLWEKVGGTWVSRRSVLAENRDRDAATTRYSARLTIPNAGTWKITASVPRSARHAATTSAAVLLSVP